jgi:ribulose bisphosphate carboxylase small subunit
MSLKSEKDERTELRRWTVPEGFVALTDDEFLEQQRYIRDRAHQILLNNLEKQNPRTKGVLAWQELALRADAAIRKVMEIQQVKGTRQSDEITIGYELPLAVPDKTDSSNIEA